MPRVFLNDLDRASHRLAAWAQGEKDIRDLSDADLGKEHGITQEAMSRKFRLKSFSFKDFVFLVQTFGPDDETLHYILGIK